MTPSDQTSLLSMHPADIVVDVKTQEDGFGMTPEIPGIAAVRLQVSKIVESRSAAIFEDEGVPVYVNLQKADRYGVAKALRSMRPGCRAKIYAFETVEAIEAYQAFEAAGMMDTDGNDKVQHSGYVSSVIFLHWLRVEDIQIDQNRYMWKAIKEDGLSSCSAPRFGDSVRISAECAQKDGEAITIDAAFALGDGSQDFTLERFAHTMAPGECAEFYAYAEDPDDIGPVQRWTVNLLSHDPYDIRDMTHKEIMAFAERHKAAGNVFLQGENLIEADVLYSQALDLVGILEDENFTDEDDKVKKLAVDLYNNLALLFIKRKKWTAVVEMANASIERNADPEANAKAYVRRAEASMGMRLYNEAIADLQKVCHEMPQNAYAADLLSSAYAQRDNRKQRAKRLYEESLENPRHTGQVAKWNPEKRYGFVYSKLEDREYFFHHSAVRVRKEPVRLNVGDEVAFDVSFDSTGRMRAANITGADGALLQGSDDPINDFEKRFLNQQIRTEILKVDFEEEHYKKYMHHDGVITPKDGKVIKWDAASGEGVIESTDGEEHYFLMVDVILEDDDMRIRVGDAVDFGSMAVDGMELKRAVEIRLILENETCNQVDKADVKKLPVMDALLETRYSGECVKWGNGSSYGFIRSQQLSKEVFVHQKNIERSINPQKCLYVGEKIEFDLKTAPDGKKYAASVTGLGGKPVEGKT